MYLFMLGVEDKLNDNRLIRIWKMTDWSRFRKMLTGIQKNDIDPKGGNPLGERWLDNKNKQI